MLPHHLLPTPAPLHIPKFLPDYNPAVPRIASSSSFLPDSYPLVSISPAHEDSPPDTVDDDQLPSPVSPAGANYHYVNRASAAYSSPISPTGMYDPVPSALAYSDHYSEAAATNLPASQFPLPPATSAPFISESPSPVDPHHPSSAFSSSLTSEPSQDRFPSSSYASPSHRFPHTPDALPDRYSRNQLLDKYASANPSHPQNLLDHRRMSEPAVLGAANQYASTAAEHSAPTRYPHQLGVSYPPQPRHSVSGYVPTLHRGVSLGSLRDLRQQHFHYPPSAGHQHWKADQLRQHLDSYNGGAGDDPISPFQSNFSSGVLSSPTTGLQYSPIAENPYGPSPPGTGTSTSSNPPRNLHGLVRVVAPHPPLQAPLSPTSLPGGPDSNNKTYSFVALPGNTVRKRPRRRYDEIERLYHCAWPDCTKAYGTLNHLNAHVTMQKHGHKRSPNEFKELRKQWRKAKKDTEVPLTGPLRRASMGTFTMRHEDHDPYESQRCASGPLMIPALPNRSHQIPISLSPSTAAAMQQSRSDNRYQIPIDEMRYPTDERQESIADYAGVPPKQRYSNGGNPSWPTSVMSSARPTLQQYVSSMSNVQPAHHSQLPQLSIGNSHTPMHHQLAQSSATNIAVNRLPPDSTLLTPLPGYQPPPSLLPPMQGGGADLSYPTESYIYDEDTQRPGTGHASISHRGADEYEQRA